MKNILKARSICWVVFSAQGIHCSTPSLRETIHCHQRKWGPDNIICQQLVLYSIGQMFWRLKITFLMKYACMILYRKDKTLVEGCDLMESHFRFFVIWWMQSQRLYTGNKKPYIVTQYTFGLILPLFSRVGNSLFLSCRSFKKSYQRIALFTFSNTRAILSL